jgi:glycosyltransferase involved in cell wall biosynthesis
MFYKRRLGRRLFPCWGRAVMAISGTMKKGLYDIFGEKNLPPVVVVRNGIDVSQLKARVEQTDREAIRRAYGYSENHLVVLALSRLIPVKGVHILIDAFALARKQAPQLRLLIAGSGDSDYIQGLKQQASELGLQDVSNFLGNVTEVEKPFRAADIFAGPYLWPEAFGLSILEAMVAGLPVIGSNSGGISELLGYGRYGQLFEENNVSELAGCLLKYSQDPGFRSQMGQAAGEASLDYSARKMCEQTLQVYEDVLGKRK